MRSIVKKLVPPFLLSGYHLVWAFLSALFFGFPSQKLIVIGVTGTNGKSSVVWLLARILEVAGYRVAASSSVEFQISDKHWANRFKMTMPGRGYMQWLLHRAVRRKCTHAILEVTSEGIRQHRHRFIGFSCAVFLNLSPEHIERHGSYEAYRKAKGRLFRSLQKSDSGGRISIVNLADNEAEYFLKFPAERYVGFRLENHDAKASLPATGKELLAKNIEVSLDSASFMVQGTMFSSRLVGEFNVVNVLAAVAAAQSLGIPLETSARAVRETTNIPGRLESISNTRKLRIFVDYAHTSVALENVYKMLRVDLMPVGQQPTHFTCVLGAAGGGRDVWKRAEFGKLAAKYCDRIIVTDEDPYDEDPALIRTMILNTARAHGAESRIEDISDRRLAIQRALAGSPLGGVVVITGKGSEPWMVLAHGKKVPWDDRAVVREALTKLDRIDPEYASTLT